MPDCDLCPRLDALAMEHRNTYVRMGIFHGDSGDACQVSVIRDVGETVGIGETWREAIADLESKMGRAAK